MNKKVRVRFAPSPTGPLHMGGVRTALYNYLFAKKQGGDFILRIEDTDQNRYVPGAENYIIEALKWCGISPNEGEGFRNGTHAPYRQSERKELYKQYALQLVEKGQAYYAFDTAEELEVMRQRLKEEKADIQQYGPTTRMDMKNALTLSADDVKARLDAGEPYVIRIKIPENEEVFLNDIIRGEVRVQTLQMDDKVLFKSDGMPTYHLANVVDDHLMEITHVIRGEEWLPSAPLHVLLYKLLGWEQPEFAHLPLLLKPDGNGKLSKRDGDRLGFPVFPLQWQDPNTGEISSGYRERGFLSEAFINMLALLGWTPSDDREILTLDELVAAFELEKVHKAGSKYNYEKALWFNQQYLHTKSTGELLPYFEQVLAHNNIEADKKTVTQVIDLIKDRCSLLDDLWEQSAFFFQQPQQYDTAAVNKKWDVQKVAFFEELCIMFDKVNDWKEVVLEEKFKALMNEKALKPGEVMLPFRIMLVGGKYGPAVFAIAEVLGKNETIERIKKALQVFE